MKKTILILTIIISLLLSACTSATTPSTDSSQSVPSNDTESVATTEDATQEQETTVDSSEDYSEESSASSEESLISEESSAELPAPSLEEITAAIAAVKESGFNTNISNPAAAEALANLSAYLEGSGYGYFYCDLEYNGYVSYGCDKDFKTASTSKLPYIKYLCTLADNGEIDLNEKKVYEKRHYTAGSGIMKDITPGGSYTIGKLMDYVLRYSDNIAYDMLIERFGLKDYLQTVQALGVDYHSSNGYTNCTASEMAALLYDVGLYSGENLSLMKNAGCHASYNYQIGAELKEYDVLQKYGAIKPGNVAYHDIAVVYAPHPYILVIYTTIDYDSAGKNKPFRTMARLTEELNKVLYGETEE